MENFGIKISKDGFDVKNQTPGSINLVFDTEANTLKLKSDVIEDGFGMFDSNRTLTFYAITVGGFEPFLMYNSSSLTFKRRIATPNSWLLP